MSGSFSNQIALDYQATRYASNFDAEAYYSATPAGYEEISFTESSYAYLSRLLAPLSTASDDRIIRDIEGALNILRAAYRSTPAQRDTITRMGQWVKTVSEFA